jgi:hypothetical protein
LVELRIFLFAGLFFLEGDCLGKEQEVKGFLPDQPQQSPASCLSFETGIQPKKWKNTAANLRLLNNIMLKLAIKSVRPILLISTCVKTKKCNFIVT